MGEISFKYWNELSSQFLLINSLLAGFSITVVVTLLLDDSNSKIKNVIFKTAIFSAFCFLISVFAMTTVKMITTEGYPLELKESKFMRARLTGAVSFMLGIISLISFLGISGWTKSKKTGLLTSVLALITLILVFLV